jgi:hypothetical protein
MGALGFLTTPVELTPSCPDCLRAAREAGAESAVRSASKRARVEFFDFKFNSRISEGAARRGVGPFIATSAHTRAMNNPAKIGLKLRTSDENDAPETPYKQGAFHPLCRLGSGRHCLAAIARN